MGAGWVVGVCINLVGSILINLGTNVMKMGHNKLAAMGGPSTARGTGPAIYKLREWQIGVTLFSIGNVANFVSFGYAAQSLLAAIGCIQFVSNVVFASWVLKERVSRDVLVATAAIVAGCVLLVSGGSHVSQTYTYKELLRLYGRPAYVSYLSVGGAAVLLAYGAYWMGSKAVMANGPEATPIWTTALPILYSVFSALIGTQSVLFSKTLAVLLRSTVQGDNQLGKWFTWFVLVAFLTSAVFWVTRLNKGLRMFPALIIVPSLQICWTLFSILSGMLYFHEYEGMRAGPTAMFVTGVAVVFVGVFLLTRASQQPSGRSSQAAGEMQPLSSKARVAYVGDEDEQPLASAEEAPSDSSSWQLSVARSAKSAPGPQELSGMLRGVAQLRQGSGQLHQHLPEDEAGGAEDSDDEEQYERALLACTSGRCGSLPPGGRVNNSSSHTGMMQQQQQQRQWSLQAQDVRAATGTAAAGGPADPQQGDRAAAGAHARSLRGKERWLRKAGSIKRRVALDFSLDETAAARLTLGLGDSHTPGFSLFTMPMVDMREMPHQASTWRSAEVFEGRSYGRVAETSLGGAAAAARGPGMLTVPADFDDTGCISHPGGPPSHNVILAGHNSSGDGAGGERGGSFGSFTWPGPQSGPSEVEVGVPAGPLRSINPLANAIDLRSTRSVSQEAVPSAEAAASKWKVIQRAIKANMQELKAVVASAEAGSGSAARNSPRAAEAAASSRELGSSSSCDSGGE